MQTNLMYSCLAAFWVGDHLSDCASNTHLLLIGDDPPRDRTSELRKKGFTGRRLGPKQMTTDTAVRVTRIVVLEQSAFRPNTLSLPC